MSVRRATVHAKWIIGRVIGTKMRKTAKVRVTRLVLDPYLLKVSSEGFSCDPICVLCRHILNLLKRFII